MSHFVKCFVQETQNYSKIFEQINILNVDSGCNFYEF